MERSIAIIGAGMGGLAAGIYVRLNGYDTTIFEQHSVPGGQCAAWKRKGFTFDGCIHHLFGTGPGSKLYADRKMYEEEKQKVAETVIETLESSYFTGLKSQVEVIDVPTLMTWERYVGGTNGFMSMPNKKFNPVDMLRGKLDSTVPGLSDFHLVGSWATSAGALFANALSGKKIIRTICAKDGQAFTAG
ncbi:MAG TPA: FAD/NAD(P)-binding protein [Candidatus Anoxymicrobiaceae bacterium]